MEVETILNANVESRKLRRHILSAHAISRKEQRRLSCSEIESALSHGTRQPIDDGCWEYKFGGIIAIVDPTDSIVLTVYPESGYGIDIDKVVITEETEDQHRRSCRFLREKEKWTSHTVAVIDQSGSMRKMDIDEGVTRSDLVWLTLAIDVVYNGINSGDRKVTDVLSVISMKDNASIMIDRMPFDWILYNKIIGIMKTEKPSNGGKFIPALDLVQDYLLWNRSRNCALSLLFLSDGKPSDNFKTGKGSNNHIQGEHFKSMKKQMTPPIERLASFLGKRLNMCFFAIGPESSDDFGILEHMSNQAKEYECSVIYQPASLKAGVLSTALRKMSTTTTNTMTTISDIPKSFTFRDFIKMKQTDVGSPSLTDTWEVFEKSEIVKMEYRKDRGFVSTSEVFSHPLATGIAWETRWFGEGKERLAKELREIGPCRFNFVGLPMVLKASITVSNTTEVDTKEFHKSFCKSQIKAEEFAKKFNEAASLLPIPVPRIEFLPCWVYGITQKDSGKKQYFLVEPQLDIAQYVKFNDNAGSIYNSTSSPQLNSTTGSQFKFKAIPPTMDQFLPSLDAVTEESDEDSFDDRISNNKNCRGEVVDTIYTPLLLEEQIAACNVMQAFSCFSFWISSRKYLVCDLQGNCIKDTCPPVYRLTDPVIHTSGKHLDFLKEKYGTAPRFGRTDRGQDGIEDFFQTHTCSKLCKMLQSRRLRQPYHNVPNKTQRGMTESS